jgi:hypothetical protein
MLARQAGEEAMPDVAHYNEKKTRPLQFTKKMRRRRSGAEAWRVKW